MKVQTYSPQSCNSTPCDFFLCGIHQVKSVLKKNKSRNRLEPKKEINVWLRILSNFIDWVVECKVTRRRGNHIFINVLKICFFFLKRIPCIIFKNLFYFYDGLEFGVSDTYRTVKVNARNSRSRRIHSNNRQFNLIAENQIVFGPRVTFADHPRGKVTTNRTEYRIFVRVPTTQQTFPRIFFTTRSSGQMIFYHEEGGDTYKIEKCSLKSFLH